MAAFPLSILALAAGIFLTIKVKKEGLGAIYKYLSCFVIFLAIGYMTFLGIRAWRHHHNRGGDGYGQGCQMGHHMMKESCCSMQDSKDSMGSMACCHMQGDSFVMDKEACEKAIGKEACEKMCKERGRCIMSKDECMKMCHMDGASCMAGGGGCGMMHDGCGMRGGNCCMQGGCCQMQRSCCGGGGCSSNNNCCTGGGAGCGSNMGKCDGGETKSCCKK